MPNLRRMSDFLLVGALALLLGAGWTARPAGAAPLPEYPELASPFGVNRAFDYPEEQAELQRLDPAGVMAVVEGRELGYLSELGIRHYRVRPGEYAGFAWDRMDPGQRGGALRFERTDALVTAAQKAGINVLPVLGVYREPADAAERGQALLPRDLGTYAAWVGAVVERYDGDGVADMPGLRFRISAWQVGETPDLLVALGKGRFASPEQYVRLLDAAADAIHGADAGASVVIGAVSSADPRDAGLALLDTVLASETAAKVDVIAFEFLPRTLTSGELRDAVKAMRQRAGARPLWCTFSGSYSRYTPRNAMHDRGATEESQGTDLVRRYSYMLAEGVSRIYEVGITEQGPDRWKSRAFYSGLRNHDGAAKLAYSSYRLVTRLLGSVEPSQSAVLNDGQNDLVVIRFQRNAGNRLLYVLWWDYAGTREYKLGQLELDVATQISLKVTDEQVEVGEMVQNTVGRFKTAVVRPREGNLELPLRRVPVMLTSRLAEDTETAADQENNS